MTKSTQQKYTNQIDFLLDDINNRPKNNYFLTVYLPISSEIKRAKLRKRLKRNLKSLVLTSFNNQSKINVHQELPQKIIGSMEKEINKFEKFYSGIGLFCQFNNQEPKKMILIQFLKPPEKENFIGKTYALGQLIWMKNTAVNALIININQKKAEIYIFNNSQLKKIYHQKNDFLETKIKDLKEYVEKRNFNLAGKTFYGTGTRKFEGQNLLANQLFLNQITEFIQQENHLKTLYDHLVIFYTYPFTGLVDKLIDQSFIKTNFEPFLMAKTKKTKQKLKKITIKNIDQYQEKEKLEELEKAKENHRYFVKGWSEVIPAGRSKKIDVLFTKPNLKKEGYRDKNNFVWLELNNGTKKVPNIAPWLVRNITESGGKILLIKDNPYLEKVEVAAKLRY